MLLQLAEGAPDFDKARNKQYAKDAAAANIKGRYKSKMEEALMGLLNNNLPKDRYPYAHEEFVVPDDEDPEGTLSCVCVVCRQVGGRSRVWECLRVRL